MEQFARGASQNLKEILNKELPVLHHLNFELITFTPYRPLVGLMLKLNDGLAESLSQDITTAVLATARSCVDVLMLTDAPLIFPPTQLALSALSTACRQHQLLQALERLSAVASEAAVDQREVLEANMGLIERMQSEGAAPINEEEVRSIDLKLRQWRPITDDSDRDKKRLKNKHTS